MPCIHDISLLVNCPQCEVDDRSLDHVTVNGRVMHQRTRSCQDQDTVEDRWGDLLQLIIQYGGERFSAGYDAAVALSNKLTPVKLSASGTPGSDVLPMIVAELVKLQREAGDD